MKNKISVIVGVGAAKFAQLLYCLYLSWQFGHAALATMVLILSNAAAFGSIVTLGASPQIVRAGAHKNPEDHISATVTAVLVVLITSIILLILVGLVFPGDLLLQGITGVEFTILSACILIALASYAIMQSYLSYREKYVLLGSVTFVLYVVPLVVGVAVGYIFENLILSIIAYSTMFLLAACSASLIIYGPNYSWRGARRVLTEFGRFVGYIGMLLHTALFGFLAMLSLFFVIRFVNSNFSSEDAALFSVGFQFFQVGIFVPSVLGVVFVPSLIKASDLKVEESKIKQIYVLISLFWSVLVVVGLVPIFLLYKLELSVSSVSVFLIMQLSVVFAVIQAFHIQRGVASGGFGLLAINAFIWGGVALVLQSLLPLKLVYSAISLLAAYLASYFMFAVHSFHSSSKREV